MFSEHVYILLPRNLCLKYLSLHYYIHILYSIPTNVNSIQLRCEAFRGVFPDDEYSTLLQYLPKHFMSLFVSTCTPNPVQLWGYSTRYLFLN